MTKQEVEQSLPLRAAKKILKNTFPWITKLGVPDNVEEYKSLIFLEIYFNPYKLLESYPGYILDPFYIKHVKKEDLNKWGGSNMSSFFKNEDPTILRDRSEYDKFKPVTDDVLKVLTSISRSDVFPDEFRLHNNRRFDINNFYIDPATI